MQRRWLLALAILALCGGLATRALADGFMLPAHDHVVRPDLPAFSVPYHRVTVNIDRQVATTEIDQAFHNNAGRQIEGTYIFPIADGMSISKFSMYVGGEELTHRILDKDEARRIYNGIVSRRQDPALLEWLGSRMIQARVFPIEANEDKRVKIAYQEALQAQDGAIKYVYPLKTEKLSAKPLDECSVEITIKSQQPIRTVYSPTHNVTVTRPNEHTAHVSYRDQHVRPDQDLVLYYTVSEKDLGVDLLTFRDPDRGDGYFLLMAAPKAELRADEVQPKDVVFVLDTSGSMSGEKIEQAKAALKFCINSLDPHDRFGVVAFSSDIRPWKEELAPATRENVKAADAFVSEFKANGGTNINEALQTALKMLKMDVDDYAGNPHNIIFLTDGQPTVGTTDTNAILANVRKANTGRARMFDFGVGTDYNAHFLDKLANEHSGYAENVLPREDIEVKVSSFYAKVSAPLLMNLALDWGNAEVYDLYPKELPDLFKGSQLLIAGRYRSAGAGKATVRLTGTMAGKKQTFSYPVRFASSDYSDEFIPRLWATRKIGYLEDQMRLNGTNQEVLEEIIRLSKEYGILTEYTSFLVDMDVTSPVAFRAADGTRVQASNVLTKGDKELAAEAGDRVGRLRDSTFGYSGVSQSINRKAAMNSPQAAPAAGNIIVDERGERVQLGQMRNVAQRSFVQNGAQWVDVNYKPTQQVMKVKAFSPAYLQLANAHPRMAQFMSLSDNVIIAVKEMAIAVGPDGLEQELSGADLAKIRASIEEEFGTPAAPKTGDAAVSGKQVASAPSTPWPLLALPAGLLVGLRRKRKAA